MFKLPFKINIKPIVIVAVTLSITGIAFNSAAQSDPANARFIPSVISILQEDNQSEPNSSLGIADVDTRGGGLDLAINGDFLYIADGLFGLVVVDITNPTDPEIVNTVEDLVAFQIEISGDRAVIETVDGNLMMLDISDPFAIEPIGQMIEPELFGAQGRDGFDLSALIGNTAFVTILSVGPGVNTRISFADPSNPVTLGTLVPLCSNTVDVSASNGFVFLSCNEIGTSERNFLRIFTEAEATQEVATPTQISEVESDTPILDSFSVGNAIYAAVFGSEVITLDASNVQLPVQVSAFDESDITNDFRGTPLVGSGDILYIPILDATSPAYVAVDISNPIMPSIIGEPVLIGRFIRDAVSVSGLLFVVDGENGLSVHAAPTVAN